MIAIAKRDLRAGEVLDGEGGYTVFGKLVPTERSLALGALPIGLAHGLPLRDAVPADRPSRWSDVVFDARAQAVAFRREMEDVFRGEMGLARAADA